MFHNFKNIVPYFKMFAHTGDSLLRGGSFKISKLVKYSTFIIFPLAPQNADENLEKGTLNRKISKH